MEKNRFDVLIIGAGLSGLCLAYLLRNRNLKVKILEGRVRTGGRIHTSNVNSTPIEMGATWLSPQHTELQKLLSQLDLDVFEQELGTAAIYEPIASNPHQLVTLPANQEPSYRIKGGSSSLIQALLKNTMDVDLELDCRVKHIELKEYELLVNSSLGNFLARKVVSTLPPYLFEKSITTIPELPTSIKEIAKKTHTWMGESIKIGLSYKKPFWKDKGLSGTIFSNPGPIPEMYDHSNVDVGNYALKGFLNGAYFSVSREQRMELVLSQLEKYYGPQARNFIEYKEMIWQNESFTYAPYEDHLFPHQNNGNEVYRKSYLNDKLYISGSETAAQFPGYMEGAVRSAQWVALALS